MKCKKLLLMACLVLLAQEKITGAEENKSVSKTPEYYEETEPAFPTKQIMADKTPLFVPAHYHPKYPKIKHATTEKESPWDVIPLEFHFLFSNDAPAYIENLKRIAIAYGLHKNLQTKSVILQALQDYIKNNAHWNGSILQPNAPDKLQDKTLIENPHLLAQMIADTMLVLDDPLYNFYAPGAWFDRGHTGKITLSELLVKYLRIPQSQIDAYKIFYTTDLKALGASVVSTLGH
jgi:hypothetical protein